MKILKVLSILWLVAILVMPIVLVAARDFGWWRAIGGVAVVAMTYLAVFILDSEDQ